MQTLFYILFTLLTSLILKLRVKTQHIKITEIGEYYDYH